MKNEIEKLTEELLNGLTIATQASLKLAARGIQPANNAFLVLSVLTESLASMTDQELAEKVMEFVDAQIQKLGETEDKMDQAIKDLLKGLGGINLN
jgi:DnaJ-domain-containing protein 1